MPPWSIVPDPRVKHTKLAGEKVTITMPDLPTPLAVRMHVSYKILSHANILIRPRPAPAASVVRTEYSSGWIKVQDWDDVDVISMAGGDFHVEFYHRGFVQM